MFCMDILFYVAVVRKTSLFFNASLPQVQLASVQLEIYTQTAVVRLPHRHRQLCCRRQKTILGAQNILLFFISTPSQF